MSAVEGLTEAETEVYFLLRKYRVQKHYRASSAAKVSQYAIYVHGEGQITEPTSSAEARTEAALLTAKEIVRNLSARAAFDNLQQTEVSK